MPTEIHITSIDYANSTTVPQVWTFEIKKQSDPDSAYAVVSNSAAVDVNGNLGVPVDIMGLTEGTNYLVRASNNCSSPKKYYITLIEL